MGDGVGGNMSPENLVHSGITLTRHMHPIEPSIILSVPHVRYSNLGHVTVGHKNRIRQGETE